MPHLKRGRALLSLALVAMGKVLACQRFGGCGMLGSPQLTPPAAR